MKEEGSPPSLISLLLLLCVCVGGGGGGVLAVKQQERRGRRRRAPVKNADGHGGSQAGGYLKYRCQCFPSGFHTILQQMARDADAQLGV